MSIASLHKARLKVALTESLKTIEQLFARVSSPKVRAELSQKAQAVREKIKAIEVTKP